MKIFTPHYLVISLMLVLAASFPARADKSMTKVDNRYVNNTTVQNFARDYAKKHNKKYEDILVILEAGKYQQSAIDAISRPAERVLNWGDYSKIFLKQKRVNQGIAFWKQHRKMIEEVSQRYQVEPEVIVAILGVETWYGQAQGRYKVLDALMTLGFDYPPRSKFFLSELEHFLTLLEEQNLKSDKLLGSYAGAMGYGQFIPSSYRAYAVSFNGKGPVDIWNDPADAVASVANYLHVHGWRYGGLVALPVQPMQPGAIKDSLISKSLKPQMTVKQLLEGKVVIPATIKDDTKVTLMKLDGNYGTEYWVGFNNFYVITRYNTSSLYTMAVYQMSQLLKYGMNLVP